MAVRTDFAAGEVLAAQDLDDTFASKVSYALPTNPQASAYTFVLADALRLTTDTGAGAVTFTIPPQASVAWVADTVIRVVNYGAGTLTIAGGAGVTLTNSAQTLAQYESAALIRTALNAWTLVPFSGGASANFSNTATGTYTDSGINYKYVTFTSSGTLTVTRGGLCDALIVAGGQNGANYPGGGGGQAIYVPSLYLGEAAYTITVGTAGLRTTAFGITTTFGDAGGFVDTGNGGRGGVSGTKFLGGTPWQESGHFGGGGGGGATAVGASTGTRAGGAGGAGITNSITGASLGYGGGGGGWAASGVAGAGADGGGSGNVDARANSGGGGGGNSKLGAAGVVIVRVKV